MTRAHARCILRGVRRLVGLCLIVSAGCSAEVQLRERIEAEWSCVGDRLDVRELGAGAYRARGCGRSAVFVCSPRSWGAVVVNCVREASP